MRKNEGFSLLEVLIFVTILSLVFIGAVAVGTVSIRNSKNAEYKILATRYAEELMDWLHGQQQADWIIFTNKINPPPVTTYCFEDEPIADWPVSSGACTNTQLINSLFQRQVTLTDNGGSVNVDIQVSWDEGQNDYDVLVKGVLSPLE